MEEKAPVKRSIKSVLLTNIIVIILSFAMLVTSTFSWFTDSVTSGVNRIVSGTLDVEATYYNGHDWQSLEGATCLFQKGDWEPGAVDVVYLRIFNEGSLALKYKVSVQTISEQPGTNAAGEEFHISQYLRFAVVEKINGEHNPFDTREDALAAVTDAGQLDKSLTINDVSGDIVVNPGGESFVALIVNMPSDTGNDANYRGEDAPKVTLGIEILATQAAVEADSYSTDYDAAAEYPTPTPTVTPAA